MVKTEARVRRNRCVVSQDRSEQNTDLWLIRHCESIHLQTGKLQRGDTPLSQKGQKQARKLAERLSATNQFVALYTSPLKRAMDTAIRVGNSLHLNVDVIEDLREIDFGQAGGFTVDEFRLNWPDRALIWEDPFNIDFQWPGGESRREFHRRSLAAINALVQAHQNDRIIIFAHTGNLCGYLAYLFLGDALRWREYPLQPASISRVGIISNQVRLLMLNDISHLHNLKTT